MPELTPARPLPHAPPATDPALILRYRDGQYAAELLTVAILHLDLFTWLDQNPGVTTADILRHFSLTPRPTDVLLTLLRAQGFLHTTPGDRHELTPLAREHLVSTSPWFLGPYYTPLRDTPVVGALLDVLRTGKPAAWRAREDGTDWHKAMRTDEFARDFTALMNCRGLTLGQALARALVPMLPAQPRLLDVGGGSGIYAAALAMVHPGLRATVLEQSPVDAIAHESISRWGLSQRINVVAADLFRDWPGDHNVHLLSNVLHDWDIPEITAILQRSAASLPPGGLLIIHEAFLNDEKTGPLPVAEYSVLLMHGTQGRCYSAAEYAALLTPLGFEPGPCHDTIADRGFMTAVRR